MTHTHNRRSGAATDRMICSRRRLASRAPTYIRAFGARLGGAARVERCDQPGYAATAPTFMMRDHSAVFRPTSPSVGSVRVGSVREILDEELHFIIDNPLDGVGEHMGRITQLVIELDVEHGGGHFPFDTIEHLIDRPR